MKTGTQSQTKVIRTTAGSLDDARQRLLQWILANEAKRQQARETSRFAASTAAR